MTEREFIERVADRLDRDPQEIRVLLRGLVEEAGDLLAQNETVTIRNFVTLKPEWREATTYRVPSRPGETVDVPGGNVVKVRVSGVLKRRVAAE